MLLGVLLATSLAVLAYSDDHSSQIAVSAANEHSRSVLADPAPKKEEEDEYEDLGEVADADPGDDDEEIKASGTKITSETKDKKPATSTATPTSAASTPAATAKPSDAKASDAKTTTSTPAASEKSATTPQAAAPTASPKKASARTKKPAMVNKVVDFAPAANVTFGDDIDDEGNVIWDRTRLHAS